MSRFERRLGGLKTDGSPRPGVASCKLPSRNSVMLENNILQNNIIQNNNTNASNVIDDISDKNRKIMEKLAICRNPTEKILLNHELRLNTIELNVDCLNNLEDSNKNTEHYQQQIAIQEEVINELQSKVNEFEKKIEHLLKLQEVDESQEKIVMDIKDIVKGAKLKSIQEEIENNDDTDSPTFE